MDKGMRTKEFQHNDQRNGQRNVGRGILWEGLVERAKEYALPPLNQPTVTHSLVPIPLSTTPPYIPHSFATIPLS